jgi:hypothetical protein
MKFCTCYNMDEPWKHYTNSKKLVMKDHTSYNCISMKWTKKATPPKKKKKRKHVSSWSDLRKWVMRSGCKWCGGVVFDRAMTMF